MGPRPTERMIPAVAGSVNRFFAPLPTELRGGADAEGPTALSPLPSLRGKGV